MQKRTGGFDVNVTERILSSFESLSHFYPIELSFASRLLPTGIKVLTEIGRRDVDGDEDGDDDGDEDDDEDVGDGDRDKDQEPFSKLLLIKIHPLDCLNNCWN